jgi:hypothetical protein
MHRRIKRQQKPEEQHTHLAIRVEHYEARVAAWVISGFLFGYFFHRIRGDDGFVKALVFALGICIPYFLSQALSSGGAGLPLSELARLVPLLAFVLFLGVFVFDWLALRGQGLTYRNFPDVYGLRTSIGYLSALGTLAAVQPILNVLGWLSTT